MSLTSGIVFVFFAFILCAATSPIANVQNIASSTSGSVREIEIVNGRQINTMSSDAVGNGVDSTKQRPTPIADQSNDGPIGGGLQSIPTDSDRFDRQIEIGELSLDSEGLHSNNEQLPRPNHKRPDAKEYGDEYEEEDDDNEDEDDEDSVGDYIDTGELNDDDDEESENVVTRDIVHGDEGSLMSSDMGMTIDEDRYNMVNYQVKHDKTSRKAKNGRRSKKRASSTSSSSVGGGRNKGTLQAVGDTTRVLSPTSIGRMRSSSLQSMTSPIQQTWIDHPSLVASQYPITGPGLSSDPFAATGSDRPTYDSNYRPIGNPYDGGNLVYASPPLVEEPFDYQLLQDEYPTVDQSYFQAESADQLNMYQDTSAVDFFGTPSDGLSSDDVVVIRVLPRELGTGEEADNWLASDDAYSQPSYLSSGYESVGVPITGIQPGGMSELVSYQMSSDDANTDSRMTYSTAQNDRLQGRSIVVNLDPFDGVDLNM